MARVLWIGGFILLCAYLFSGCTSEAVNKLEEEIANEKLSIAMMGQQELMLGQHLSAMAAELQLRMNELEQLGASVNEEIELLEKDNARGIVVSAERLAVAQFRVTQQEKKASDLEQFFAEQKQKMGEANKHLDNLRKMVAEKEQRVTDLEQRVAALTR